jgi:peptidyl-prolyl cis-trans isomerase C
VTVASIRVLAVAAVALSTGLAAAGDDSPNVARVGELNVSAADVTRRLAAIGVPPVGSSPGAAGAAGHSARQLVENVIVPELVASQEAKQRGLDKGPKYADREREVLRQSLEAAVKAQALADKPVTNEEIQAYFTANKARFEQPLRLRLWRILLDDEATAKSLLEQAKSAGSPAKWGELAREKSVDKATNLRQGDLGFVHADGDTDAPRVRVDPVLFRAAAAVKDGEFVAQPVKEGAKLAVIWRRGSLPAKLRTVEQERESIKNLLERQRADEAHEALVQKLRGEFVKEEHPDLLEQIPEGMFGNRVARPRPSLIPRKPPPGLKLPRPTDSGLR